MIYYSLAFSFFLLYVIFYLGFCVYERLGFIVLDAVKGDINIH